MDGIIKALMAAFRADPELYAQAESGYLPALWIFLAGSMVGFGLEGIWARVKRGRWERHASVVWGPFCTIYGTGALLVYLLISGLNSRMPAGAARDLCVFLACAGAGTAVEYLSSLGEECLFGSMSWDYSRQKFNLCGRVSLRMTLIWGALGYIFSALVMPALKGVLPALCCQAGFLAGWWLLAWLAVDALVSMAAVDRWRRRLMGCAPRNRLDAKLDCDFDDGRMARLYPGLRFRKDSPWMLCGAPVFKRRDNL